MLISVTLSIVGDLLDPDDVTRALGIVPHYSRRKGDVRRSQSGKSALATAGIWEWHSRDPAHSLSVNDHLARLQKALGDRALEVKDLPNVDNAWVDVHIVVGDDDATASASFVLSTDALAILQKMGVPAEFTIEEP